MIRSCNIAICHTFYFYLFQHYGRVVWAKAVVRETMMLASELKKSFGGQAKGFGS